MNTSGSTITSNFIQFSAQYAEPVFNTKRGKDWIEFGEDNALPAYTESLLDKSPDHAAILNGTIQFAYGNGLVMPENNAAAQSLFKNGEPNRTNPNDLNTITAKAIRDLVVHGACCINVRWQKDRKKIADVHYVSVSTVRIDADSGYWLSSDWTNTRKNEPVFYPAFSQEEGGSQLLYIKLPSARQYVYGMPGYWGARNAILLQYGLSKHFLNRVDHSFVPSGVIVFDEAPTPEEQDKFHKAFGMWNTGADAKNNGGLVEIYGAGVKIERFEGSEGPKDFFQMISQADAAIRSAHRVTGRGACFGLNRTGESGLATNQDIEGEFLSYSKLVVRPVQNTILSVWNMLAEINGAGDFKYEIDPFIWGEQDKIETAQTGNNGPGIPDAATGATGSVAVDPAVDIQATALNGSQIDSLVNIVTQVTQGNISKETALPLIQAAFPMIAIESIQAMIGGATKADPVPPTIPPANGDQ